MASTNKTETLELNQWLETDHPKREDFNADNEKIDAFATGIAGAFHPAIPNAGTGTWWVWDVAAGDYADTGEPFHGEPGVDGLPGPNAITEATTNNLTGILKADGSGVTTAIEGEDYAAPRPLTRSALINRRFQIWQDGEINANVQTGYTSADMWLMVRNSPNGTVTAHRTPSGMFVTNNSDDTVIIIQYLFGGDIQTQQQWIGRSIMTGCSCVSLDGSADLSFNDADNVLATEHIAVGETRIQTTLSEASALGRCLVAITLSASSSIELNWVDCVEGNTLSPPPHLDFGLDLLLCQQYYLPIINPGVPWGNTQIVHAIAPEGLVSDIPTPIQMAATPTPIISYPQVVIVLEDDSPMYVDIASIIKMPHCVRIIYEWDGGAPPPNTTHPIFGVTALDCRP